MLVVLAHFLTEDIKAVLKENGIEIINLPRKTKRTVFSSLPISSKFHYKDELLKIITKTKVMVAAESFLKIFQSIALSLLSEQQLLKDTCGISIKDYVVPVCKCVSVGVASQDLTSIGNLKSPSKVVKIGVMN